MRNQNIVYKQFIGQGEPIDKDVVLKTLESSAMTVASTMGPGGGTVLISHLGRPDFTKDGFTVSQYLTYATLLERTINQIAVDAANRTVKEAGDGTTTCIWLVYNIYKNILEGMKDKDGLNLFKLKMEMSAVVDLVKDVIEDSKRYICMDGKINKKALTHIATISANNDKVLGGMIADLICSVGVDGKVFVEKSTNNVTYTKKYDGYTFDTMPTSPKFLLDDATKTTVFEKPVFIIIDKKLDTIDHIEHILQAYLDKYWDVQPSERRPLVVIAADTLGSVLSTFVSNLQRGIPIIAIKCPEFLDNRADMLEDIRLITKTHRVFSDVHGETLDSFGQDFEIGATHNKDGMANKYWKEFGSAKKVVVSKDRCVIITDEDVDAKERIDGLRKQLDLLEDGKDKDFVKQRISRLSSGIGTIYVGGDSDAEHTYLMRLIDDSEKACFAALKSGVVPGAGRITQIISEEIRGSSNPEQRVAVNAISKALRSCFNKIAQNLYRDDEYINKANYIAHEFKIDSTNDFYGIDPMQESPQMVDLFDRGIIDPAQVTLSAIKNAISVVGELITTKYQIIPQE